MPLNLDYYYGGEAEQYSFYRIPKVLFTDEHYKQLSVEAKVPPGEAASCTSVQLCTKCGAVLEQPKGHRYLSSETKPTCTEMGYFTYTCEECGDIYKGNYTDPTGHAPTDWIIDKEPTTSSEGEKHKECANCGEVLETESIEKLYMQSTTNARGEAVVGGYLVTVTDTNTTNPVAGATVTLNKDDSISILLPDNRLIDYAAQTTVKVQFVKDKSPVEAMPLSVADKNGNYSDGQTDKEGTLTIPGTKGLTNSSGKTTLGYEASEGNRSTVTVEVKDYETGRPIPNASVSIGKTGRITVTLPDGTDMDEDNRITVVVTDNRKNPLEGENVTVKNDLGQSGTGKTDGKGELTVPPKDVHTQANTNSEGQAVVGDYLVTVTDTDTKNPISEATVKLHEDNSISVRLPDGRLLDYADQTTVAVQLVKDKSPVVAMSLTVTDKNDNFCAEKTDKAGQITVPGASGMTNDEGKITVGGDDKTLTIRAEITETGRPIKDAAISIGKDGEVTVTLPKGVDMDENHHITVTVTDNRKKPVEGQGVTVNSDLNHTADGKTDKEGKVTVPELEPETVEHSAYIEGYPDGTFGPSLHITRAEASAIFARLLAAQNGDTIYDNVHCGFSDVSGKAWYAGYVKYLETFDILTGYEDGTFKPNNAITRSEFVAMAVRFYTEYGPEADTDTKIPDTDISFTDVTNSYWAAEYIRQAAAKGWVIGYTDGTFGGDSEISRAEVVTLVNRLLVRTADKEYISANLKSLTTFKDMEPAHWAYYDVLESANTHNAVIEDGESWMKK